MKIKVKYSGLAKLSSFDDFPDGNLIIGESDKNIPFKIKRFYVINNLFNRKATRGKHAHKKLDQYIFCLSGSCTIDLDDGQKKQSILFKQSEYGLKLGPLLWHTMRNFSPDCVLLVVADDYYKESDYIRNYKEFLEFVRTKKKRKKTK